MIRSWPGRVTALQLLVVVAMGCTAGSASSPPASATPSAASTTAAISPVSTSPPASPSPTARSTEAATQPDGTLAPPPEATLVAGPTRQPGEPGSWALAGGTSSAPWLPADALDPVQVSPGPLTIELEGNLDIVAWTAHAATADDTLGGRLTTLDEGTGSPTFDAPAAGAWVVAVDLRFADNQGSASYYWHVVVG
jgi:hypothetical protein